MLMNGRFMNIEVERKGDSDMGFHTSKDMEVNEKAWGRLRADQPERRGDEMKWEGIPDYKWL